MDEPLVSQSDVETALVRPLTPTEATFIEALCDQASAKLRTAMASVDTRIAAFQDAAAGVDPDAVAAMLAGVIKRVLVNPRGLWSIGGETTGPYSSPSETYAGSRGGDGAAEPPGELVITAADLAQLGPVSTFVMAGTILTRRPVPRGCW